MFDVIAAAVWWCLCGIGFLPLLIVMETLAAVIKGPEYQLWVQRNRQDLKVEIRPLAMGVVWLFIWPFVFAAWVRAGWSKMTLTEFSLHKQIKQRDEMMEMKRRSVAATRNLTAALGSGQGTIWLSPFVKKMPVQVYARAVARQAALICTHLVVVMPNGDKVAVRLGLKMEGDPPDPDVGDEEDRDFVSDDLATTIQWCNDDARWNELCEKGSPEQREVYRKGIIN